MGHVARREDLRVFSAGPLEPEGERMCRAQDVERECGSGWLLFCESRGRYVVAEVRSTRMVGGRPQRAAPLHAVKVLVD